MYCPPDAMMNKDFIKAVLDGTKDLVPMANVHWCNPPHYDEISVKNLYPRYATDKEVMKHMPDKLPKGKMPDRAYWFNILNTVHPDRVTAMIEHSNKVRFEASPDGNKQEEVLVTDEWWAKLNLLPYYTQ